MASQNGPVKRILSFDIGIRNLGVSVVEYNFEEGWDPATQTWKWNALKIHTLELIDVIAHIEEFHRANRQPHQGTRPDEDQSEVQFSQSQSKSQTESKSQTRPKSKPKTAKDMNIHELCQAFVRVLHNNPNWYGPGTTDVRVEQQPLMGGKSSGSARMKIVQHCILTFFETFYACHPELHKPNINASSPSNKLKCIIVEANACAPPETKTSETPTTYAQRKDKAVVGFQQVLKWCTADVALKRFYSSLKKHNDVADCVLQALYEIQVHGCEIQRVAFKAAEKRRKAEEKLRKAEVKDTAKAAEKLYKAAEKLRKAAEQEEETPVQPKRRKTVHLSEPPASPSVPDMSASP